MWNKHLRQQLWKHHQEMFGELQTVIVLNLLISGTHYLKQQNKHLCLLNYDELSVCYLTYKERTEIFH